jgi:hypothetical protein
MPGKRRASNQIDVIHFDIRFRSENDVQFERLTEQDSALGVETFFVRWAMQLFLLFSTTGRFMAGP